LNQINQIRINNYKANPYFYVFLFYLSSSSMSQLGTILRSRREELNLTLAEVSRATTIRLNILEALEKGKFSILPPTYIRSFCKTYWAYLRLPQENFERIYADANISAQEDESSFFSNLIPQNPEKEKLNIPSIPSPLTYLKSANISPRLLSTGLTIAFIIFVILVIYFVFIKDFFSNTPIEPNSSSSQNATESNQVSENSNNEEGGLLSLIDDKSPDSIILEARCIEKSYIQVTADGKKSEQVTCEPGDVKRWAALKEFIISGNIGGFILKRNDVTLPSLAKKGNLLVQAKITLNDITSSSNPYKTADSYSKPSNTSTIKSSNTKASVSSSSSKSNTKSTSSKSNTSTKSTASKSQTSASKPNNSSSSAKKTASNKTVGATKSKTINSSPVKKSNSSASNKSGNSNARSSNKLSTSKNKIAKPTTKTDKSVVTKPKQENKKLPSISPIQINHTKR
jgi:cytoskeletal protein RodZ